MKLIKTSSSRKRGSSDWSSAAIYTPRISVERFTCAAILTIVLTLFATDNSVAQQIPDSHPPIVTWQQTHEQLNEYIEYLKKQLEADPNNRKLQLDLARNYYQLATIYDIGALSGAEKIINQILEREPSNPTALAFRGALTGIKIGFGIIRQDRIIPAVQTTFADLDRAVELAPDDLEIRQIRIYSTLYTPSIAGRDHLAVEDTRHTIRLLEKQPDTARQRSDAYLVLGDAYRKTGDLDQARASWAQAVALQPGSRLATAVESRLQALRQSEASSEWGLREIAAFFGFLIGTAIFAILVWLLVRDFFRMQRRSGLWAAAAVTAVALLWNGLNLLSVIFNALGSRHLSRLWFSRSSEIALIFALSPILFGLAAAYRFYKATFMDIVLKRGLALLTLFALSMIYGRLIAIPTALMLGRVSNDLLRWVFYTTIWIWLYAFYPTLRDQIYKLVDRHLFKRRDYSRLLDWFDEKLRGVPDESSLISAACLSLQEAFAAESARFVPATEKPAADLSPIFIKRGGSVLLRSQIGDPRVEEAMRSDRAELAIAIRSGAELAGLMLVGPRAYGLSYLSEELSVLRAFAIDTNRLLDNLRLHEARRKQAIDEEELRKLVAQSELMALRAQINPHFFFNALNSVASLINDDPQRAEALLENLAELFRHAFKPSSETITLQQELELIETYLEVEKVRLGDKLQFKKYVLPETLAVTIPALAIQPLIENSIKHGIGRTNGGGTITLSSSLRNGCLNVIVSDTGSGIASSEMNDLMTRGVGLSNVNGRLIKLYGQSSRLRIDSTMGQGTTVSFSIPTRNAHKGEQTCKGSAH